MQESAASMNSHVARCVQVITRRSLKLLPMWPRHLETDEEGGWEEFGVIGSERSQECFTLGKNLVRLASRKMARELSY